MADPRYPVVMIGAVPIVVAPQDIDVANAEWFRKMLLHAACRGRGTVVVNMTGTRFIDASVVHVLTRAHERAVAAAGQLLLVTPTAPCVLRVLALTGLDQLIPHYVDLLEALEQAHAIVPRPSPCSDEPAADTGLPEV